MSDAVGIEENPGTRLEEANSLLRMVYVQAAFLMSAYLLGIWLTKSGTDIGFASPLAVGHIIASSGFTIMTGVVGPLAAIRGQRLVAVLNILILSVIILGGALGLILMGTPGSAALSGETNLVMMVAMGAGIPITGLSIRRITGTSSGRVWKDDSPRLLMTYLALGGLSLTVVAGATVAYASPVEVTAPTHLGFAAFTIALVIGIVGLSVLEDSEGARRDRVAQRLAYFLLGLTGVSLAAGDGLAALAGGGLTFAFVMAEATVMVYAFLLLSTVAPISLGAPNRAKGAPTG